jgi:uncharacterized protein YpuA (DUF1002 family)
MPTNFEIDSLERIATAALTRVSQHEKYCEERERKMEDLHKEIKKSIENLSEKFDAKFFWVYTFLSSLLIAFIGILLSVVIHK